MANGVTVLDPNFLQRGLATQNAQAVEAAQAAAQPQPLPRAPSLFDQVQTGLFSTGNPLAAAELSEKLTGPFAGGIFGKKAARARTEFVRDQLDAGRDALLIQQESAGLEMTPQRIEAMDQFIDSPLGLAGAAQFLAQERQQEQFDLPRAGVARQRAATEAALAPQRAEEKAEAIRLSNESTSLANAESINVSDRAAQTFRINNQSDFQRDVQGNIALAKGQQSIVSYQQLEGLLLNPDATALDIQNAIVALAQILEPGLAVRNDDRIAINTGATPGLIRLVQDYNQFISGDPDLEITKQTMLASGRVLIAPRASSFQEAVNFYEDRIIPNTPGTQAGDTIRILGLTEDVMNTVLGLEIQMQQERPRLRQPQIQLEQLPGQGPNEVIVGPDGVRDFGQFE